MANLEKKKNPTNPWVEFNNADFRAHFRFIKQNFLTLVDILWKDELEVQDGRGNPLLPMQQLALIVAFYAGDAFLRITEQMLGVKVACTQRTIKRVTECLFNKSQQVILPSAQEISWQTRESIQGSQDSYKVDGTRIRLDLKPSQADLSAEVQAQDIDAVEHCMKCCITQ